jgi:predicted RNase H-like nuclease (RuvC/YqgF family)
MSPNVMKEQRAKSSKLDTEVAVLQVRVGNVEEKFNDIKEDLKAIDTKLDEISEKFNKMLKEVLEDNEKMHSNLEKKITALEKWRWMIMGAGAVIGYLGIDSLSKLFS